jgi:uncharacterized OB-fold protein
MMGELVFRQEINLPYSYTAGAVQRAALIGLREGRLIGSTNGTYTAVPASPFAPDGAHLRDTTELEAAGTLVAVTVAHHRPGAPALGLIAVEGASQPLLHRLDGGAEALEPGARGRAVWREQRTGSIDDILHFAPA